MTDRCTAIRRTLPAGRVHAQSMVEFALLLPAVALLIMGSLQIALISMVWIQAAVLVVLCGFFVLGLLAYRTYMAHPPVPDRVVDPGGTTLFTGADVGRGQEVFLHNGLMEYGSVGRPQDRRGLPHESLRRGQRHAHVHVRPGGRIPPARPLLHELLLRSEERAWAPPEGDRRRPRPARPDGRTGPVVLSAAEPSGP